MAVNVFFADRQQQCQQQQQKVGIAERELAGRDVWCNRESRRYEEGRRDVARLVARFEAVDRVERAFALERLAREILEQVKW